MTAIENALPAVRPRLIPLKHAISSMVPSNADEGYLFQYRSLFDGPAWKLHRSRRALIPKRRLLHTRKHISDHPRCISYGLSVCLSVCLSEDNFRKSGRRKFIFTHTLYLQGIRVKFIYEGHRVKVKVTGAKKVENSYSRSVKLRSAITPVL